MSNVKMGGKLKLTLVYDCLNFGVSMEGDPIPICLGQAICEEALRVLDEQRRMASAINLQKHMMDAAQVAAIEEELRKKGFPV